MKEGMDRIVPLDEMEDYDVAEGEPDVRGWDVLSGDGDKIGEVDQLLVDTSAMKVRYLDVDLNEDLLDVPEDRHVLIPIGFARLDEDEDHVIVDRLKTAEVPGLPEFRHERITPEIESEVRESFGIAAAGPSPTERGYYEQEAFEEGRFFRGRRGGEEEERRITRSEEELAVGKREVQAGQVEIGKRVKTEHVREPVELKHNEVEIERRPVSEMRPGEAPKIEEEEIHVPLREEEAVVEKRPVAKEELIVRKRPVTETEEVEADVRREQLEIEKHGRVREASEEARRRRGGR